MWCWKYSEYRDKKEEEAELQYDSVDIYIQNLLLGGQSVRNKKNVRDEPENT